MNGPMRRRTHCTVPGHGDRCEVATSIDGQYARSTEERLALRYELHADEAPGDQDHPGSDRTVREADPRFDALIAAARQRAADLAHTTRPDTAEETAERAETTAAARALQLRALADHDL